MKPHIYVLIMALLFSQAQAQTENSVIESAIKSIYQSSNKDWKITDQYSDKSTNLTYVYVQQRHHGISVYNAISNIVIRDNKAVSIKSGFIVDLKAKVKSDKPSITPIEAINATLKHLELITDVAIKPLESVESENKYYFSGGSYSTNKIIVELVYLPVDNKVILCWNVSIDVKKQSHWWNVRVDASNGNFIQKNDYVVHCSFDRDAFDKELDSTIPPTSSTPSVLPPAIPGYRVFPLPVEAPTFGSRVLLANPSDPSASPFGWHDVNGVAGEEFTITRGNNVYTYEDENNDDQPGYSPDGGATLTFDFPYNGAVQPVNSKDASLTNLFYANNTIHDKLYRQGFNEAAGNFQQNNYGAGGLGGDHVLAEGFDGSGFNNANFGTPPDGLSGRMQMYLWAGATCGSLTINSPGSIAGQMSISGAEWNIAPSSATGNLIVVDDGTAFPTHGCFPIVNNIAGKIAVIDRGTCLFFEKALTAQAAGAIGLIIINHTPGAGTFNMGGADPSLTLPSVMISYEDGVILKNEMLANSVSVTISICVQINTDSDFDNGVIAHEYGHGVSNRLTGGPSNVGCLFNGEQGGEGWSDWLALMLTIEPGDASADPRTMGSYLEGNTNGIRSFPYSTDMTINPHTYGDLVNTPEEHYIGEIWCSAIWDLSRNLIDAFGYNNNPTIAAAGNNIAMRLVLEGMKLQPCGPGFLDARDAILLADHLLYNDAHKCMIWETFARRGMGALADQGSPEFAGDETEDFSMPTGVHPFVSGSGAFCKPNNTVFDAGAGWLSYSWSNGATSQTITPGTFGTYIVTVTGLNCAMAVGSGSGTMTVSPSFIPIVTASPEEICPGGSSQLNVLNDAQPLGLETTQNNPYSSPAPYGDWYTSHHEQYLFLASELTAAGLSAGNIQGLSMYVVDHYNAIGSGNFTISIASTNAAALTNTFISTGFTQVFYSPTYFAEQGWNFHVFSSPFNWNGISNVVVDVSMLNCTTCPATPCINYYANDVVKLTKTSFQSCSFALDDGNCTVQSFTPTSGVSTTNLRPQMAFRGTSAPATTYLWSPSTFLSNPNIKNPVASNVTATTIYSATVTRPDGCYGTATQAVTLITVPAMPSSISGPFKVCKGSTGIEYCAEPVEGATSYIWILPTGVTGTSTGNCITLSFSTKFTGGTICVKGKNSCFTGANKCFTIGIYTSKPGKPTVITGQSPICDNNYYTYCTPLVANATSYQWTISGNGGSGPLQIVTGQGTDCITVFAPTGYSGNQKVNVSAVNCKGKSDARLFDVKLLKVPATPGNISGSSPVCKSNTKSYSVGNVPGASYYNWAISGGALIQSGQGTRNISVKFSTATSTSAVLSVIASNACGVSSARTKTITVKMNCKQGIAEEEEILPAITGVNIFPNPTSGKITVQFESLNDAKHVLKVTEMTGRIILSTIIQSTVGINSKDIDLSTVSKGMYFISLEKDDAEIRTIKIVVE